MKTKALYGSDRLRKKKGGVLFLSAMLAAAGLFIACPNPSGSDENLTTELRILNAVRAKVRANPKAFYISDPITSGDNILLFGQGGPAFDVGVMETVKDFRSPAFTLVVVKQEQMVRAENKTFPVNRIITVDEAREINLHSAAIIYALAEDFKRKGHKVSIYSHSFGSVLMPEMYRSYGDKPFEKVLIGVGRVKMQEALVKNRLNPEGPIKRFDRRDAVTVIDAPSIKDGLELQVNQALAKNPNFCLSPSLPAHEVEVQQALCDGDKITQAKKDLYIIRQKSSLILQGASMDADYITLLKDTDLSKIIYYYGGKDAQIGKLLDIEVQFLTGRTGTVAEMIRDIPPTPVVVDTQTRRFFTIPGKEGKATVKYGESDGHFILSMLQERIKDAGESFGNTK